MSLPTRRQAYAFLEPLRGKSTIFLVKNRRTHVVVSRFIIDCLAASRMRLAALDTSCIYGVNIQRLTEGLSRESIQQSTLLHLSEDAEMEDALAEIATTDASAILMDDLNALLHLLSPQGQRSGIRRLSILYHVLSYSARINKTLVLGTVFKSDYSSGGGPFPPRSTRRSLPKISDLQVTTELRANEIVFQCEEVGAWPADGFRAPLYFDERT